MLANGILPDTVNRVLARNDLMMLARDAEAAVGIVRESKTEKHLLHETELFSEALKIYCDTASVAERDPDSSAILLDAWDNAGVIVRLCDMLDVHLDRPADIDATAFHAQALVRLAAMRETRAGEEIDRYLHRGRTIRYRAVRDLRLSGGYNAAINLADQDDKEFVGTGADPYRADYHYELAVALLLNGQASEVRPILRDAEEGYWKAVAASQFVRRYRVDFAFALAAWAEGDLDQAAERFAQSHRYLRRTGEHAAKYDVDDLLLSMARADVLVAGGDRTLPTVNRAVDHLDSALRMTERVRNRWRVISRSSSPLAAAFRRIYGDLARAAAALPGRQAAELGLRVALSAKQSGFAGRMRADRFDVDKTWRTWRTGRRRLRTLIDQVVRAESGQMIGGDIAKAEQNLHDLRLRIQDAVSPMLADTVLPVPPTAARVVDAVGDRYALDYVGLPDTVTNEIVWFQTLIEPSGAISFCQLTVGDALAGFVAAVQPAAVQPPRVPTTGVDWGALGEQLLPRRLRDALMLATREQPVTLIISAHSALSLMPWAALRLDKWTCLVHRAVITQTPVLTYLSGPATAPVAGPALIHLVSEASAGPAGVDVERERAVWDISSREDGYVPLSECALEQDAKPVDVPGTFAAALSHETGEWRFAHVASHGKGTGLDQTLELPEAPVSAGRALTLRWPPALLMASCHVGRLLNIEHAEPLNFVMAVLAGGGECVVACIDEVKDYSAGGIAADIVRRSRQDDVGLDAALREAQLKWVDRRWPEAAWALYTAYAR